MTQAKASRASQFAVRLDQALQHITIEEAEELRRWFEADHVAELDQMEAGARDTSNLLDVIGAMTGGQRVPHGYTDVPEWMRLSIFTEILHFIAGTGRTCMHLDPRRPQMMFAVAWKPGLMVCQRCIAMLKATNAESKHCDGCGAETDTFHSISLPWGILMWEAGICTDCYHDLAGE